VEAEGARGKFGKLFVAQNIEGCSMARVISIIKYCRKRISCQ